ncbi:hypothetical protein PanWU01x14_372070, partial [Parasponia andersonii]
KNGGFWRRKRQIWPRVHGSFFTSTSRDLRRQPVAELHWRLRRKLVGASSLGRLR